MRSPKLYFVVRSFKRVIDRLAENRYRINCYEIEKIDVALLICEIICTQTCRSTRFVKQMCSCMIVFVDMSSDSQLDNRKHHEKHVYAS